MELCLGSKTYELKPLQNLGVATTRGVEAYSHAKAGKAKWVNRGELGRRQVCIDEIKVELPIGISKSGG